MKQYITWTRMVFSNHWMIDPTESVNMLWSPHIKFTELSYSGFKVLDSRLLGVIEYDDTVIDNEILARFMANYSHHSFVEINANKALGFCQEWYPEEAEYFSLDDDGFTIIDARPEVE